MDANNTAQIIFTFLDKYGVSISTMVFLFWVLTFQLWPFAKMMVLRQLDEIKDERKQAHEERKAFLEALDRRDKELEKISTNFVVIHEGLKRLNQEMMEVKTFVIDSIQSHRRNNKKSVTKIKEDRHVAEKETEVEEVENAG
jgi:F0F1-type ATP synthase membrane subunit b/b'